MPRRPKLGQHFLVDPRVAQRMVDYAELSGKETVLEVGPGRGALTLLLAERAGRVVAVEKDAELVDELLDARLPGNVEVVLGDALKVALPKFDKVVSNVPYGISSDLIFRLLEEEFEAAVLMLQREFAERLGARVGSEAYGRLSVNAHVRAEVEALENVPSGAFAPRPKVASLIVRMRPRAEPPFPIRDARVYEEVVRAAFQHRRKTLRNALLDQWPAFAGSRDALLARLRGVPHLERRAETLSPAEFSDIAGAISPPRSARRA